MYEVVATLRDYLAAGGYVMPPLILATLALWFGLGFRLSALRGHKGETIERLLARTRRGEPTGDTVLARAVGSAVRVRGAHRIDLRRRLDEALAPYGREVDQFRVLVRAVVAVAPVLGLLGTVTGMIETFASLDQMALFTQSGGIAGGISQALFTTQLGLAVAIPGLVLRGLLERRQRNLEAELGRLRDLLCGEPESC